ncbi:RNA chaperone Hfq [Priestia filamentosa]|uniref:RNA chaperone Hfq n=1 Tax=Priestia filamentosa TaxID=1402861 RepID=UPI00058949C3
MQKRTNLQDKFLNQCRKTSTTIQVYMNNGFPVFGKVEGFDDFTVLIRDKEDRQNLLYKSAISTIKPEKEVEMKFEPKERVE